MSKKELVELLLTHIPRYWRHPVAGLLVAPVAFAGTLWLVKSGPSSPAAFHWAAATLMAAAFGFLWWATNRPPQTPRDRIGVLVAIACDSDSQERQVRADFIGQLRAHVATHEQESGFHLLVYSRALAERIETERQANEFMDKSRAHFMVWGRIHERIDASGKKIHLARLAGIVRHPPAPSAAAQAELQRDFTYVLPQRIILPEDGSVFHFEATSEWLDVAALYIVGVAALMTGHLGYAELLLLRVEERLTGSAGRYTALQPIIPKIPKYLRSLYLALVNWHAANYIRTHEEGYLIAGGSAADRLLARDPQNYNALLLKAIVQFAIEHDVAGAKHTLRKCKSKDAAWRYSLAFLHAYSGDLIGAEKEYKRAFKSVHSEANLPIQVEEFIQLALKKEPDRTELHYCSGIVNYYVKKDHHAAKADFEQFLASPKSRNFPAQRTESEHLLAQLTPTESTTVDAVEVDYKLRPLRSVPNDKPQSAD